MKKVWLLIVMLFLAACGGGGGASTTGGQAGGGGGATGKLALKLDRQIAKAAALAVPAPGWMRVVVSNPDLNGAPYKQVLDVAFGSPAVTLTLPAATGGYSAEVVLYTQSNGRNMLSEYGALTETFGVTEGDTVTKTIGTGTILPTVSLDVSADDLYSTPTGNTYSVAATIGSGALQQNWALFVNQGAAFTTAQHSSKPLPNSSYTALVAPALTAPGNLYFQAEFFMKSSLLDIGESATNWTFNYNHAAAKPVLVHSGDATITPPSDTVRPVVVSFTVPSTVQPTTTISPISIVGTDNAAVYGYKITETSAQPAWGEPGTDGWTAAKPTSYTVTETTPVNGTDTSVTLYAWVEDRAQVSLTSISRVVTINNAPVVTGITIPQKATSGTFAVSGFTARNNSGAGTLQYLITNAVSATTGAPVTPLLTDAGWSNTPQTSYTVDFAPAAGRSYTVPIFAWVKDGNNVISRPLSNYIVISDLPEITKLTLYNLSVSSGIRVWFKEFIVSAVAPNAIQDYAITKTAAVPATSAFTAPKPAYYDYVGATSGGNKYFYVWVRDDREVISQPYVVTVQFANPAGANLDDPAGP